MLTFKIVWTQQKNIRSFSEVDSVTLQFGLKQFIKKPTHILGKSSSYIDLIFISHSSLVMESDFHPSFHSDCHYQITYAKFNLKIHYPPPYERKIWYYQKANTRKSKNSLSGYLHVQS